MKNSKLTSFAKTLSKISEIFLFLMAGVCALCAVVSYIGISEAAVSTITELVSEGALSLDGFSIDPFMDFGELKMMAVFACGSGFVVCMLGGMIFRNIVRVFRNTELTRTPFTKENVKLIRNIGRFAIATPFVSVVANILIGIFAHRSVTVSIDITTLLMGLIILCLSRFFEYGVSLEDEVEGMI